VRRARIARTLRAFARSGGEDLHTGPGAADLAASVQAAGGVLTTADLAAVAPRDRAPLQGSYRGWTVYTMPPPSSGGVVLLQALAVLEGYALPALGRGSPAYDHLLAEVLQHGFADRARHLGDPDRVAIPVEALLAPARVREIRAAIDPARAFPADHYGAPLDPGQDAGTLHISVIDADGMAVALTTTINTSFGSRVFGARSGVLLNNQMDDFVARPGVPNAYGLVGSRSNAVAPGARPLSSMSPTVLVAPDGRRIAVGASGGPFIISSTLQVILDIVDFGRDPNDAVSAPRIHHQWQPRLLFVDEGVEPATVAALRAIGHEIKQMPMFSAVQVVTRTPEEGLLGASDPRKAGAPAGAP
jgi:gamma-glutamyltranspeptidase / glutathione hydrolase